MRRGVVVGTGGGDVGGSVIAGDGVGGGGSTSWESEDWMISKADHANNVCASAGMGPSRGMASKYATRMKWRASHDLSERTSTWAMYDNHSEVNSPGWNTVKLDINMALAVLRTATGNFVIDAANIKK